MNNPGKPVVQRNKTVPRTSVLEIPEYNLTFDQKQISVFFKEAHDRSEAFYNGDGSWGHGCADPGVFQHIETPCTRPMIRNTAWRVSGYLAAGTLIGNPVFKARAKAGCERLVREQCSDGYFPYYLDDSGWPIRDPNGIMYVTGIAVNALLDGYEAFQNPYFLHAAYRGCEWAMRYPHVSNANYNSFCVFALARTATILSCIPWKSRPPDSFVWALSKNGKRQDNDFLIRLVNRAAYFTKNGFFPDQQPNGGWPGHNSWIWYHGIILLGHARLLQALKLLDDTSIKSGFSGNLQLTDSIRQPLKESTVASINYLIINLTTDGELYKNHESYEPGSPIWPFLAIQAMDLEDVENSGAVRHLLKTLASAVICNHIRENFECINPETKLPCDTLSANIMGLGSVIKYGSSAKSVGV